MPKAISKLSAMFCNHSCMAICFYLRILAVAHTLCSAWALGACGNPFLYITCTYIYNENRIDEIRSRCLIGATENLLLLKEYVRILTATSLLLIGVVSLPSGLVHEVHCTECSTHPSKMIAAWRSVNTLRIPLPYDVECVS